jgi:hypothetical protein
MMSTLTASQPRRGRPARALAVLVAGAAMLAGCSTAGDHIPAALGGLPEGVPERPATPAAFPAVHQMPPARSDVVLSEAEKKRLREELTAQRERRARDTAASISADPTGSTAAPARNP